MGVESDWSNLGKRLISCYAKCVLEDAMKLDNQPSLRLRDQRDARLANTINSLVHSMALYRNAIYAEKALDAVDLGIIFERLDLREQSQPDDAWGYEDLLVQETLAYFKNDFFKWINQPDCDSCGANGDKVESIGVAGPPIVNPDEISRIEQYKCKSCGSRIEFPRINSPAKLLETRRGRCGEWVNCFMLVLQSVLGPEAQLRYIWNMEDHVWSEYYSKKQKRWVHLDPCENVFDEPSLYCANWGKKMSYVIGVGNSYIIDLSDKYITDEAKRIPKHDVVSNEATILKYIKRINARLMIMFWHESLDDGDEYDKYDKLYEQLILVDNKEVASLKDSSHARVEKTSIPKGRQTGDALWTKARGEDGA